MNAEAIRDVARTLIDRQPPIAPPGQEIPLDSAEWPMEIRSLAPRAVEVAPELVTIRFGKLGRGKGFCIFVFGDEAEGFGTVRLAPGIWYWEAGAEISYEHSCSRRPTNTGSDSAGSRGDRLQLRVP
jgi:hypothetical protein